MCPFVMKTAPVRRMQRLPPLQPMSHTPENYEKGLKWLIFERSVRIARARSLLRFKARFSRWAPPDTVKCCSALRLGRVPRPSHDSPY
jgi:hypothetical protein